MTCRDFERGWNELLDAGGPAIGAVESSGPSPSVPRLAVTVSMSMSTSTSELERTLRDHAADCPACREVATRYQLLHRALGAWSGARPAAPVELADRILAAAQGRASSRWGAGMRSARPFWRIGVPLVTAAAAALALVFVRPMIDDPRPDRRTTVPPNFSGPGTALADTGALNAALADATAATWDLARSASEPAARISRQVLDAATGPEATSTDDGSGSFSVYVSSYVPTAPDSAAASAMLRQMSDRLATSVGPLSTTARHAFGFLVVPTFAKPEVRQVPPAAKGA
jgi:hypothetical protein